MLPFVNLYLSFSMPHPRLPQPSHSTHCHPPKNPTMNPRLAFPISSMEHMHDYAVSIIISASSLRHRVPLGRSLPTGPMEAWLTPLMEMSSPLLEDFPAFLTEFDTTLGERDRWRVLLTMIYTLRKGNRATSTYASEFRQLACDVRWGDKALCDQFCQGFRGHVK